MGLYSGGLNVGGQRTQCFYEIWGRGETCFREALFSEGHVIGILRYPSFITVRTGDQTQNFNNVLHRKIFNKHFLSLFYQ